MQFVEDNISEEKTRQAKKWDVLSAKSFSLSACDVSILKKLLSAVKEHQN
jgi:hypothetical protein